ncbi:bifunctional demethylmenaquinone methyltransferase/2-methoxy-6-polyprenyl-1,4-benzoquinol methylase [PVC group bacterium (ex Bugula neritina AB1)]|nr:bifunctional demethylmenaquinone methyltransferase/2-methoxy-6-polyprenyl-1,4-benzoquinol methylase [PVC group bacterium (ex Bugula neritina AB1)]
MRERKPVWSMFDRIAHRYDLVNRLLSLGQDQRWRKKLLGHFSDKKDQYLLDVATGTGDMVLMAFEKDKRVINAVGVDLSKEMLSRAKQKVEAKKLSKSINLDIADAENLPFEDNTFDVVTIVFGIRNVPDYKKAISSMFRVLKEDGRLLIMEFSLPNNKLIRQIYLFYFRHILPKLGGWISGSLSAYQYLNQSVEDFPYGEAFSNEIKNAGFNDIDIYPLTFGVASIYCAKKT